MSSANLSGIGQGDIRMSAVSDGQPATLRLISWNLGHRTREKAIPANFYQAVHALRPDVLVLNEFRDGPSRSELRTRLRGLGMPHVLASTCLDGHNQVLVASQTPIETGDIPAPQAPDSHAQTNFLAVRHVGSGLTIVGMRAPAYAKRAEMQAYWQAMGQILRSSKGPVVLAGDFNVDPSGPRALPVFTHLRLRGWKLPQPSGPWSFVSGSRIDHVLASPPAGIVTCEYVREAGGVILAGADPLMRVSDHAALVAEVHVSEVNPDQEEQEPALLEAADSPGSALSEAIGEGLAYAEVGSQRWLQVAVNEAPHLVDAALIKAGAIEPGEHVQWRSPIAATRFEEYRDGAVLRLLGCQELTPALRDFWPNGGPMWDGLGVSSTGRLILLEAKAHIPEAASPASCASPESLLKIERALAEARALYAPRSNAVWSGTLYQYANRLAFQYFFNVLNGRDCRMVFLNFCNAHDVGGPQSPDEWRGATEMVHALLGLPSDLRRHGVHHAYLDVRQLLKST